MPDSDRWSFSAGSNSAARPGFAVDAGVSYISFNGAAIDRRTAAYSGTAAQTPILVDGKLQDASALVFSLRTPVAF